MNNNETWIPYDDGKTIGTRGSEGGVIIRDDEHPYGARITLERDCLRVPFAITMGVYYLMIHTRFFADEPTAQHAYDEMKPALVEILVLIPTEDDADYSSKRAALSDAAEQFVAQFP